MIASNPLIVAAATASPLIRYDWPDRGIAPRGYTKGMALAFAEAYRLMKAGNVAAVAAACERKGNATHDLLDYYAPELAVSSASNATGADRLVSVFSVMLGLGVRESSGRHCCGPDTPEDRGPPGQPVATTPENAEAGLFQVSYDSIAGKAHRQALVDNYAGQQVLLVEFGEGARCERPAHWPSEVGSGRQAAFQKQMKGCPLFAAIYTAMLLREQRTHWGPINQKEVEVRRDAVNLFTELKTLVDAE